VNFKVPQVQSLKLKFNEQIQFREFTYLAIGSNPYLESEMETYSEKELKGSDNEIAVHRGDLYMVYPVRKQLVIAFGEGNNGKLGVGSTSNSGPKVCEITKEMGAKRVFSAATHSVVIDKKDQLW
jgi:hypothetical protein